MSVLRSSEVSAGDRERLVAAARALIGLDVGEGTGATALLIRFRDDFPMGEPPEVEAFRVTVDGVPLFCEIGGQRHRSWIRLTTVLDARDLRLICAYTDAAPVWVIPEVESPGRSDAESALVEHGFSALRAESGRHRRTLREVLCVVERWNRRGAGRGQVVVRPRLVDRHLSSDMTARWVVETRGVMMKEEHVPYYSGDLIVVRDSDLKSMAIPLH